MFDKTIRITLAILLLSLAIALTYKICYIDKNKLSDKEEKKKFENLTNEQKIERILELESLSFEIIKFDEESNKSDKSEGIESEIIVDEDDFNKIKLLLEKKYELKWGKAIDELTKQGGQISGKNIFKDNLECKFTTQIINECFGNKYDEFFNDDSTTMKLDMDIKKYNEFIESVVKIKNEGLYFECLTYSDQYERIKAFCDMIGVDSYDYKNDYECRNYRVNSLYDNKKIANSHIYYWIDEENKHHIFIDYIEYLDVFEICNQNVIQIRI